MCDVRKLTLYCLVVFSERGTPRVWCYKNTQELLDAFLIFQGGSLFPYTFTKEIFVTSGHPLFDLGEVIEFYKIVKLK